MDIVRRYILKNVVAIVKEGTGFKACQEEYMESLITDDELNATEEQIYEILVAWNLTRDSENGQECGLLFKHVRWTRWIQIILQEMSKTPRRRVIKKWSLPQK